MSIRIDQKKCVGCRKCSEVCPGTLIVMEDKKAVMKYPKNCWGCVSCVKECKAGAIDFFLGADIGGNGSIMNVKKRRGYPSLDHYKNGRFYIRDRCGSTEFE